MITLLTDFGAKDGNVGVMKGVILGIAPRVQLVDVSHEVGPQNIGEAAWILGRSTPYFPEGTIHLVVVDPGVGTERRPMAARIGTQFFVGPDNGVATRWIDRAERDGRAMRFVELDRPEYWLPEVSRVFHGRDIFAPVAAHLAGGAPLEDLGTRFSDPVRLPTAPLEPIDGGVRGSVAYVDHFGNVRTNIGRGDLAGRSPVVVEIAGKSVGPLVETFGDRREGDLVALFGSTGDLIVSVVNGSAGQRLGCHVGDPVVARWETGLRDAAGK